jgi:hypothetical protein
MINPTLALGRRTPDVGAWSGGGEAEKFVGAVVR